MLNFWFDTRRNIIIILIVGTNKIGSTYLCFLKQWQQKMLNICFVLLVFTNLSTPIHALSCSERLNTLIADFKV